MTFVAQYAFNLWFNAACSFLAGLTIIWLVLWVFRVGESRWKQFLLTLPFVKILWDLAYRGIPSSSVVHAGIDPLSLPPRSQTLTLGTGVSEWGPIFKLVFTTDVPGGKSYSASFADYLFALMSKYLSAGVPYLLLLGAVSISAFLILRRIFLVIGFERWRRRWRKSERSLNRIRCGWRKVDVYVSSRFEGTPFTGGILQPYICIPEKTDQILTPSEREAVIGHELEHVKNWDLLGTLLIMILGDLFWFVPGYHALSRKMDRLREILADDGALKLGVRAESLGSVLLKLQGENLKTPDAVLHSALFRNRKLLKVRVSRLLGLERESAPRLGWQRIGVRVFVSAWTVGAVLMATFGGNHEISVTPLSSWLDFLPPGLESLLKMWGFE